MKLYRTVACLALLSFAALAASKAEQLFKQAEKAEREGQIVQAYLQYAEAAAADPNNLDYWQHALALRSQASLINASRTKLPDLAGSTFGNSDPALIGRITDADIEQARKPLAPVRLNAPAERRDYDLNGDSKSLWEQLAAALHLNVVFDTQYQPTRPLRFQVADADYRDALRELEAATDSFVVPVNEQQIFVANDTAPKRTQFERMAAVVIPFNEAESVQEIQEVATGVRGTLDLKRLVVDTQRHLILIRDDVTKVRLAQKVLEDLMRPRGQVAIDVEIISTDNSSSLNYGLSLPNAFPLINFPVKSYLHNIIPTGYSSFLTFGGGASLFGLGVTSAELFATVAKSSSNTVIESQMVAMNGQPSSMHIGERYPILNTEYLGGSTVGGTSTGITGTTGGTTNTGTAGTGTLQLSQTSLSWSYGASAVLPAAASITVTSSSGTINYAATVESSSPWLAVNGQTNASGTLPATLTVSPGSSLASLGTGSYQGTVQVRGSDGSVAYISVNLTVNGGAQSIVLSPTAITLSSTAAGYEVQQAVTVTSASGGAVTTTVAGTGLTAVSSDSTIAPNTPFTVTVFGNPAGLSAQTYVGIVSISVGGVTAELPVSFQVLASGSLELSQSSIPWTYTTGGSLPQSVNVTVASTSGSAILTAAAASANSWLLVNGQTQVTATLPTILTISPSSNTTNLGTGTYTGTVQLSASDGSVSYLNVSLVVNGGTATGLTVSPNPITLSAPLGSSVVQQTVTVTSSTAGTLAVSISGSGLSVENTNTTVAANTPVTFTLNANPSGLTAQNYVGTLSVTVGSVSQNVEVTFSVGAISSGTSGTSVYTPPPTFTFEDLGLVLKVTPHVQGDDEVSLDIDAEFKLLGPSTGNGIPAIENRKYESKVSVKTGEWAVLAGLMTASDSRNLTGFPLLSAIPFLANKTVTRDQGQTLIILKPHILIDPPSELPTLPAWTGSETRLPADL